MTETSVSVYLVNSDGSTGQRLGSARLVDPMGALIVPPIPLELSRSTPPPLRAGIAWVAEADELNIEVIDVGRLAFSREPGRQTIAGIELTTVSRAPIETLTVPDTDDTSTAFTAIDNFLGGPLPADSQRALIHHGDDGDGNVSPMCTLLHICCPAGY